MHNINLRPGWVEVDLSVIGHNLDIIRNEVGPDTEICAVVKANAYGHGAVPVTRYLLKKGIRSFAVATVEEALELREITKDSRILLLGMICPEYIPAVLENDITVGISTLSFARLLSEEAVKAGRTIRCFAFLDTGMCRVGFLSEDPDTVDSIEAVSKLPGLDMLGLLSHFSGSNDMSNPGKAYTAMQLARFSRVRDELLSRGVSLPVCSLANSYATMMLPESRFQMVRPGAVLYGSYVDSIMPQFGTKAALSVKAKIMHLKDVPAGSAIGYNRTSVTTRTTRIATINLGYADGIPRVWGGRGYVLINGRMAPLMGVVCMDQFMVDVTDVPDVKIYDEVVIIGKSGDLEITADTVGEATGGIFDTLVCGLTARLPYVYKE